MSYDPEAAHEAMRELVAVYALDAADPSEVGPIEDHLRSCPRCREELAAHRQAAALLAYSGADAPAGVWDRIAGEIGAADAPAPPKLELFVGGSAAGSGSARSAGSARGAGSAHGADPTSGGWAWRRRRVGAAAAAAAAVVALAATGTELARQEHRIDQLTAEASRQALLGQATAAALNPSARRVSLTGPEGGAARATAAVLPSGVGYVVTSDMARLSRRKTYQLWSITGGRVVSAGLMGSDPGVTEFHLAPGASSLAVTVEPAGGTSQPTSPVVASGPV